MLKPLELGDSTSLCLECSGKKLGKELTHTELLVIYFPDIVLGAFLTFFHLIITKTLQGPYKLHF